MLGGASRVNLHDQPPSFCSFVRKDFVQEPSYPSISKTFVQPRLGRLTVGQKLTTLTRLRFAAAGHIGDLQILHKDHISLGQQITCGFKMPLSPLPSNALVQPSYFGA